MVFRKKGQYGNLLRIDYGMYHGYFLSLNIIQSCCMFFMCACLTLAPQFGFADIFRGARGQGLATATVSQQGFTSVLDNQVGLVGLDHFAVGFQSAVHYGNFSSHALTMASPLGKGVLGYSTTLFGFDGYRENQNSLCYVRSLGKDFDVSLQLSHVGLSLGEYGRKDVLSFALGFQTKLSKKVRLGGHLANPIRPKVAESEFAVDYLASWLRLGASYQEGKCLLLAEVEQHFSGVTLLKAGLEYQPIKDVFLRTGVSTNGVLALGLGVERKKLAVDFSVDWHQVLGLSPAVGVGWRL